MTKQEVQQRVLQNGKPIAMEKFEWDEVARVFSSSEDGLVLDFAQIDNCTFKTNSSCTFKTGSSCTFDTGDSCTFETGPDCTFRTSFGCTFKTGSGCMFATGSDCTFATGYSCTFKTGDSCVVVRRDIYEVIELYRDKEIRLGGHGRRGWQEVSNA